MERYGTPEPVTRWTSCFRASLALNVGNLVANLSVRNFRDTRSCMTLYLHRRRNPARIRAERPVGYEHALLYSVGVEHGEYI